MPASLVLYGLICISHPAPLYAGSRTCWLRINTPGSSDRFFKGSKGLIERTLLASQRHSEPW